MKKLTSARLIVAGAGDAADLRYATGFTPVDPVVYLDTGRRRHLVVPLLEVGRARQEAPRVRVWTPQELRIPRARRRSVGDWAAALLRQERVRGVSVAATFPAAVLRRLERTGVRVRLAKGPLFPRREIKSEREVARVRDAQRAAVAALREAVRELRRARVDRRGFLMRGGRRLTSEDVRLVIERELLRHHCQARDTIVAGGRQGADPHDRGHGPLRAGEPIVLDIFPQHKRHGYWGDVTRTVVKGRARPEVRRMYEAVRRAQAQALRAVRAGAWADGIHRQVQASFARAGFVTESRDGLPVGFFHGTGHGVGLDIHESPSLSTVHVKLRAGQIVTVEPGLYYPEFGGVRIEDTVVVTTTGCRVLCPCGKTLEI